MLLVALSSMTVQAMGSATSNRSLGYFTMPEIQVEPGETFVIPISFTCEDAVRALGIYTTVPEGFEVISVEKTDRVIGQFQYATPEGACNMAIYDFNNQRALAGNDGAIVNVTLKASKDLSGDYTYTINSSDYGIVGSTESFYPVNVSTTIHVNGTPAIGALGYFTMPEVQAEPGETFVLPVSFTCENSVYSLAFGVSIPEGFEVVSVEKADRVIGTFQYGTPQGAVNVAIYDFTGAAAISGNDGVVVNITLKATEDLSGDYTFTLSGGNYGVVGNVGNPQYPETVSTTVHVNGAPPIGALGYFTIPEIQAEPGETFVLPVSFTCENSVYSLAFGVSIPDGFEVVSVEKADRVIGTFQYGTPEGAVNVAIYDLSGAAAISGNDGVVVNITLKATESLSGDYTFTLSGGNYGVVGHVGNPQYPENASTTVHVNGVPPIGALGYFTMPEIQAEPGETFVLPVSFTCENSVYSLAFGVSIPEGFEVVSVEKADRVIGTFQYGTPAGAVNVAIYDFTGAAAISGNDGVVVNITLKATEDLSGNYTFTLSDGNYGVVGHVGNPQYPESVSTTVHVNGTPPTPGALGYFTMPEIQAQPGETFVLPVSFTCEDPIRVLAFGVSIPEGFEVVSVEQGDRVNGTFQYGTPAGACNVAIYDLDGARVLEGNDGVVVNITLKATEVVDGDYTVTISQGNYGIVGIYNNTQYPYDVSTTIHITTVTMEYDVNGDNKVSINDVTDLIKYLLSNDPTVINMSAADVNHDGKINIGDVTDLIRYLLSRS